MRRMDQIIDDGASQPPKSVSVWFKSGIFRTRMETYTNFVKITLAPPVFEVEISLGDEGSSLIVWPFDRIVKIEYHFES